MRIERHFDLFIKFEDGTYHSSENHDRDSAVLRFETLREKHGILYAQLFDEVDQITGEGDSARCISLFSQMTTLVAGTL
jgi:hypothetical protein